MYSIYANPEHVHFLVSRSPQLDEESLSMTIICVSASFNGREIVHSID
jgi:hypothetical protein